jgi:hypothetical protein
MVSVWGGVGLNTTHMTEVIRKILRMDCQIHGQHEGSLKVLSGHSNFFLRQGLAK